jgi:hypothetical protein
MPIARTSIITGPAIVQFGGGTFITKEDIKVTTGFDMFDVATSILGKVDERVKERKAEVTLTPAGEWENLAVLWPYGAMAFGKSIFDGASFGGSAGDRTLIIHTIAGVKLTFQAAAITKMPDIILSATKTLIGPVTFTCINKDNTSWDTADSFVKVESAALANPNSSFDPANILTQPYLGAWAAPFDSFSTMGGFAVSFNLKTNPIENDSDGIVDHRLADLSVEAKCQPIGFTEAQLVTALAMQGSGAVRGRSQKSIGTDLVISGTGVEVLLSKASMRNGQLDFGAASPRIGEVIFSANRSFTAGVADPLFTVGTGA